MKEVELTSGQRELFCRMFYRVFVEIRILGSFGKAEQVAALANAFHNLPLEIFSKKVNFDRVRMYIDNYQRQYPRYVLKDELKFGEDNDYLKTVDYIESLTLNDI
jgi:hypothetical protein